MSLKSKAKDVLNGHLNCILDGRQLPHGDCAPASLGVPGQPAPKLGTDDAVFSPLPCSILLDEEGHIKITGVYGTPARAGLLSALGARLLVCRPGLPGWGFQSLWMGSVAGRVLRVETSQAVPPFLVS